VSILYLRVCYLQVCYVGINYLRVYYLRVYYIWGCTICEYAISVSMLSGSVLYLGKNYLGGILYLEVNYTICALSNILMMQSSPSPKGHGAGRRSDIFVVVECIPMSFSCKFV